MSTDSQESLNEELFDSDDEGPDHQPTGEPEPDAPEASDAPADIPILEPHEAEHYAAIRACSRNVERLADALMDAKEQASDAKKAYDAEVTELRSLIRRGPDPQGKLPLTDADDDPSDDDAWRITPIGHLNTDCGLPPRFLKPLEEAKLSTLGKLSDAMNAGGDTWHYDLDGIGDKAAEHIADAFTEFWDTRNDEEGEEEEDDDDEGEEVIG